MRQSPPRLVLDTNLFVAATYNPKSASRELLNAVDARRVTLLVSPPVFREYRFILSRAVRSPGHQALVRNWIRLAEAVFAGRGARIVPDDPDDDKFIELAIVGNADAIVSSDGHLHAVANRVTVPILRPQAATRRFRFDRD